MAKLEHLMGGIKQVQSRLNEAESIKSNTNDFLSQRMDESDKKMDASLADFMKKKGEESVFLASVNQTMLQTAQNSQVKLGTIINDLKVLERQANDNRGKIKSDVSTFKGDVSKGQKNVASKLDKLSADLAKLPTQIPEPEKVDLSGLDKAMMALGLQVDNIPTAKIPDMSPNFSKMEKKIADLQKKLSTRVHTFEIERNSDDLVKRIVVSTK